MDTLTKQAPEINSIQYDGDSSKIINLQQIACKLQIGRCI